MANNELMAMENVQLGYTFTTFSGESRKDKAKALNALNAEGIESLSSHQGETIMMKDVVAHAVRMADDNGEMNTALRIVIIDENGVKYGCVSKGVAESINKIFGVFGMPHTWEEALPVVPKRVKWGKGMRLVLEVDESKL